jgi:thermostable 8-oxoguanine DNA glycosylase
MEEKLRTLAEELALPIGVLDLYLWYMKTGKVLK